MRNFADQCHTSDDNERCRLEPLLKAVDSSA